IWTILFVAGGLFLFYRGLTSPNGLGKAYVKQVRMKPDSETDKRMKSVNATFKEASQNQAQVSIARTAGLWVAALFTLAIFSFIYRDNVFYKLAEAVFVGVTAAYWMVAGFWEGIVERLLANLAP